MKNGGKILIVDDENSNLKLLQAYLRPCGYSLRTASSGPEALRAIREETPALVLLDVMMPGMDGFQVCRALREEDTFRLLPVVMVTALNHLNDKVQGLESGADDFLSKPIRKEELIAKVRSLLRIRALQMELEESKRELAEKNLRLEQLGQFKEQMTQMLVHDLRNPLTGITGNLDLLAVLIEPKEGVGKIHTVLKRTLESVDQLMGMLNDILDVGRMKERQLELRRRKIDVFEMLSNCAGAVSGLADRRKLKITVPAGGGDLSVWADQDLLRRVIHNLLQNSLKFTPEGGRIHLDSFQREGMVHLRVTDTGDGVPEEFREWIFRRFGKAPNGTASRGSGFGLGLPFCRLAAEAHGGRIWVDNPPGGGSRFVVSLPASPGEGKGTEKVGTSTSPPEIR